MSETRLIWNHRLFKIPYQGDFYYEIKEVFYDLDENDEVVGISWTADPLTLVGSSPDELTEMLCLMQEAHSHPVIVLDESKENIVGYEE